MPAPNPTLLALGGHRGGSSGADSFIPEHTKAAYAQGASAGVTYLVPDVISTKDGVLMVMYGNELSRTSNVADLFPDRMTTKTIDDGDGCGEYEVKDGYFSEVSPVLRRLLLVSSLPRFLPFPVPGLHALFSVILFHNP